MDTAVGITGMVAFAIQGFLLGTLVGWPRRRTGKGVRPVMSSTNLEHRLRWYA